MFFRFLLRVSPSLREITIYALAVGIACRSPLPLYGESPSKVDSMNLVAEKTQQRLDEIAGRTQGVMGLVVEDLTGEYRFAFNEDRQFAQASAIKIPILMTLLKHAEEGKVDLREMHWIEKKHQVAGSGVLSELGDHTTQMSTEDLAVLMILVSDNTATNILIDLVGMKNVSDTMFSLGAEETRLQRRMLDTAAAQRGDENLSTPADAVRILRTLHEGKFVSRKVSDHVLAILRKPKSGDVKAGLPEGIAIASKPGAVPGVTTEWAIVELKGRPYAIAVMGSHGVDDELKDAIREISQVAYEFFSRAAQATKYGAYVDPAEWERR
jgi:beta-lactamase class A